MRSGAIGVFCILCSIAPLAWSRRPPHADLVKELYGPEAGYSRYSNNLLEDSQLDVPGLISKYGYPVEVHNVVTEDGYILEMQRIPYGRDSNNVFEPEKPVVLVMHGLFSSSADWVLMGPGTALAYELAEAGFDVWLGNARGNFYSRKHISLDPDDKATANDFWNFSWEQIGSRDLPAMIDYALTVTGKPKLHYIGHSQGTTAFWSMGALRPEYNDKIITMQALAPVAYMHYNENPMITGIAPYANNIEMVAKILGIHELLPKNKFISDLGAEFCKDGAVTQAICTNLLFLVAGRSEDMHNATMFPVKLAHTPAGASVRQLVHYGQLIEKEYFRRFDYGPLSNLANYKSLIPPSFDLSKISSPVYLHYCEVDIFAALKDVFRLAKELGNLKGIHKVSYDTFSHLDFMWGTKAVDLVYRPMINLMKNQQ